MENQKVILLKSSKADAAYAMLHKKMEKLHANFPEERFRKKW